MIACALALPFATPTIVQLHRGRCPAAALWGLIGCVGFAYVVMVGSRMRGQGCVPTRVRDWAFHVSAAHGGLWATRAIGVRGSHLEREALFAVGSAALLLLFVGIHNAWDRISYSLFANLARYRHHGEVQRQKARRSELSTMWPVSAGAQIGGRRCRRPWSRSVFS